MKNLNPTSGTKQIGSGFFYYSRIKLLDTIKNKRLKPNELGYFLIFLASADWDSGKHRKGYIRHTLTALSTIWGISDSTLSTWAGILCKKQFLIKEKDTYKVNQYELYTTEVKTFIKSQQASDLLKSMFPELVDRTNTSENISGISEPQSENSEHISEISEPHQINNSSSFRDSSKVEFNMYPKKVIIKQDVRTNKEYEEMYKSGGSFGLSVEEMRVADTVTREERIVEDKSHEKYIIDMYFKGDSNKYENAIIHSS